MVATRGWFVERSTSAFLSESKRAFIHEKTLWVLENVGISIPLARALDLLVKGGAVVDRERDLARLPRQLVEHCLSTAPGNVLLAARDSSHDIDLGGGSRLVCCADGEGTLIADDATGVVRDATVADMRDVCRLYDALPETDFLWTSLVAPSLDPIVAPLVVDAIALREASKHLQSVSPKTPRMVPTLVAMLEGVAGCSLFERPIYSFLHCTVAPLQHDPDVTEASLDLVTNGATVCLTSMPQMGSTAPMSVLGTSIITMAELLSGVVLFQLACPGCQLVSEPMPGATDMLTGQYLGGAPEVGLANVVCVEMSRFYGLPTIGSGSTTDAKGVNFQAGVEGMLLWLSVALAGADGLVASAFFNGSRVFSPAKAVLDADAIGLLHRFIGGVVVEEETALLGDIARVGPGGHFLGCSSTRARRRSSELFEPRVFHRERCESHVDTALIGDAAERAREILAEHHIEPLPEGVDQLMDSAIEKYRAATA
jgi:trimethylamine---corrinoid protein Co-methyltransferase